jgi:formylglycine-generating enzyme required for sulfatase activity
MLTEEAARVSSIPQQISTSLGDTLRFIIPGTFAMGAGRREPGRRSNEIEKNVELTRSFYLGEQEISNRSFKQFDPGHDSGLLGRALLSEEDRPVVNVSWEEAVRFSNWLSEKDGLPAAYALKDGQWHLRSPASIGYRLPTEAEWAWAARYASGKLPTRFPWGDNMPPTAGSGNYADVSAANMVPYSIKGYNDNFRGPAPSGTYASNELGIFDLAGNVSEWINDYYSVELHRKTLVDPLGPIQGDYYVIRGSNYTHGRFSELRWTFRDYGSDPRPDVGFRIARYVE